MFRVLFIFSQIVYKWHTNRFLRLLHWFWKKNQNFEMNHLGGTMTNINLWVPLSFSHNFFIFFSNRLQMALRPQNASHGFHKVLKYLQIFEISLLSAEMTNINIWVPLSFSHSLLYFSQIIRSGFQSDLENKLKIKNCVFRANDMNINIWVTLKIAQNVFYFSSNTLWMVYGLLYMARSCASLSINQR